MDTRQRLLFVPLLLAFGLAGCGGNEGGDVTNFTVFVKDQLASTSETSDPVTINDRTFKFSDLENPGAYDDQF